MANNFKTQEFFGYSEIKKLKEFLRNYTQKPQQNLEISITSEESKGAYETTYSLGATIKDEQKTIAIYQEPKNYRSMGNNEGTVAEEAREFKKDLESCCKKNEKEIGAEAPEGYLFPLSKL